MTETVERKGLGVIDLADTTHAITAIPGLDVSGAGPGPRYARYPDWHPTEDLIVFENVEHDPFLHDDVPPELYTVRVDGSGLTRLLPDRPATEPWMSLPSWTSDGTGILESLIHGRGDHSLAVVAADGSRIDDIGGDSPVLGAHPRQQRLPSPATAP